MSEQPSTDQSGERRPTHMGRVLRAYRMHNELSLRICAEKIGISAATLMRIEQGYIHDTDANTLLTILTWLMGVPPTSTGKKKS